jgi:hypothetical protein
MQYQKIKRARDIGKPNKLEIANTISYESNIIRAEISSGTVIFTAQ